MIRRRLVCRGAVQGVGFRPAVHRLAQRHGLAGSVGNDAEGATIELEGAVEALERFCAELERALPPLARLEAIEQHELEPTGALDFEVRASTLAPRSSAIVPADAAPCAACRAEVDDPEDRRHRYPFTTCTHCGPRFSVVETLPYDRERTTMARFALCPDCTADYTDPANRRFHAESIACPACGPRARLLDLRGVELGNGTRALELARAALERGAIVAVKGVGGYQLACRSDDAGAIARLRERKRRASKPFALMVRDLDLARGLVELRASHEELLISPRAPIVLAPRRASRVLDAIAPGLADVGVMLPSSPLHLELFRSAAYGALVMTSGNAHDEPICRTEEEALERLAGLCDLVLCHDRPIARRCDDSVVRTRGDDFVMVRRSRGWVPDPTLLPSVSPEPVLALGAHLQNTVALGLGSQAFLSQHVGDLDTDGARGFQREVYRGLEQFLQVEARVIAIDEHPDYPSSWLGLELARERGARVVRCQHHLAHAAAVLGEHRRFPASGERAAAIVLDGTGYGPDGTAWGAEWLLLDGDLRWRRTARATPLALAGGERAVREPWRVALAALVEAGESTDALAFSGRVDASRLEALCRSALASFPRASGAGRLFEAAGALLGLCAVNTYEGEAAARLEALGTLAPEQVERWREVQLAPGSAELPSLALLVALARRLRSGESPALLAAAFHATFCELAAELAERRFPRGIAVALAGGCLVNRRLSLGLSDSLARRGFEPLLPRGLPAGDGGIAYGQLVLATTALARGCDIVQDGDL